MQDHMSDAVDALTGEFPPLKPMEPPEYVTPYYEFRVEMDTGRTETVVVHSHYIDVISSGQVQMPVDLPKFYATTKKLYTDKYWSACGTCGAAKQHLDPSHCHPRGPPVWIVDRKQGLSYHYWTSLDPKLYDEDEEEDNSDGGVDHYSTTSRW